jgi:hypothetical protein
MNSTTFPAMKVGKNQTLLPSGVKVSNDGKYHYWQCSVSGLETFAKPDYWVKIMAKYKTEANLVKTYVCKKAKALQDEGMSQADIIATLAPTMTGEAKKARKEARVVKKERKEVIKKSRKPRTPSLKSFAVGKVEVDVQTESGSLVKEVVPVYPWQGNPEYFGSGGTSVITVSEATKDSCALPNRYLDDECRNCPLWKDCTFERKFTESDWKKGKKAVEAPKITPIRSFGD